MAVNGFAAYRVSKGTSLNERMVTWHLMEDVLGWVLVFISGLIMMFWKVPQLEAGLACVLALWILYNAFRNLKEAFQIFLQAIPAQIDQSKEAVKKIALEFNIIESTIEIEFQSTHCMDPKHA